MGLLKLDALSIAAAQLAPCIACIFNACQRVAALPRSWALCGITPIHKGGDTQDPGNYRGIAVGSLLAKLYACILNELLMKWTEQHQLRARGQAGFRRDHRTTDQTFVVRTLIEKAKADRQPLLLLMLIYILVVGQFGLATGSGGITQSNVHTTSRVHQINNVHAPLPKSWSTQTRLDPYPSSSAQ